MIPICHRAAPQLLARCIVSQKRTQNNNCQRCFSSRFNFNKFKILPDDQPDFVSWQKDIRDEFHKKSESKGLMEFDESIYNEQFKLTLTDGDAATENEKKIAALKAAIELYKERQPRLKQDHPHFINWCILRMYEFDIIDNVELYELLFECFPPYMYHTTGIINSYLPKPSAGYRTARDLILIGQTRRVKPTYALYRNVVKVFGEKHQLTMYVRRWAWFHYVFRKHNPYPLPDGTYNFAELASNHQEMVEYIADRTMDQRNTMRPFKNTFGEYVGHAIMSRTQEDLARLQVPDDNMKMSGPHSIWVGKVQRWYWVLRREERGEEFEGAPLGVFVSPYKEMSKEGAQLWLEDCQQKYKGVAGSNVLFDVPDETLYINPEDHFKERVALFSDGIDDVHVVDSILPEVLDESKKAPSIKKVSKSQNIKLMRDKVAEKDDDEW